MKTKKAIVAMTFLTPRTPAGSDGFLNLSRFQARGAHSYTLDRAVDYCTNFLQIRKPSARRPVICVAHIVSRNRLFAAYFTCFCHNVQKFLSFTSLISSLKYANFLFYAILFSKLFCRTQVTHVMLWRFPLKARKNNKVWVGIRKVNFQELTDLLRQ